MYNLYTYEKKLFEKQNKEEEEKNKKQFELKRKKKSEELCRNHNERMKNFIFTMCEKPIILGKNKSQGLFNNTSNEKNFVFFNYKTQRQRLKEMELYNDKLNEYNKQRKDNEIKRNILKIKNHRDLLLIQPEMKFMSKSKLEKIMDSVYKEDVSKTNTSAPLLDKLKEGFLPKPKRIKEYYRLIDKNYLNDSDIKKAIKYMNEFEQNEKELNYTYRNYISWKYYNKIIKNENKYSHKNKMNQTMALINTKNVLKSIGKEEKDILNNDDIKTHFKGAEQYIEFKELRENKNKFIKTFKFRTTKNEHKEKNNSEKNIDAIILAKKLENRNKKNEIETYPKDKLKAKTSRNFDYLDKKFPFMVDITPKEKNHKNLNKKKYCFKDLSKNLGNKKLIMNNLMENEINNAISKDYMKKHHSISLYGKLIKIPKKYEIPGEKKFSEIENDINRKDKVNILINQIISEKRKVNDEKYKLFVKKYCRSIFGFKGHKLNSTADEIKAENKLDYVAIDGKPYNKNDIKLISNIIFRRCNYYNKKRTYNE